MNAARPPDLTGAMLVSLCLVAALAACSGDGGSAGASTPAAPPSQGSFGTSVALDPFQPQPGADFTVTFGYAVTPASVLLGAYAIEIRFDPALVRFVSVDPAMAQGRVVNTLQAGSGSIVLAGANTSGFSDGMLFRGSFRALAPGITLSNFPFTLREAADTQLGSLGP